MMLEVCEKNRIAYYWMTSEEKEQEEQLKEDYRRWNEQGYKVCTFVSGNGNLVDLTKELLLHNKEVLAKKCDDQIEQ